LARRIPFSPRLSRREQAGAARGGVGCGFGRVLHHDYIRPQRNEKKHEALAVYLSNKIHSPQRHRDTEFYYFCASESLW
jgi:hypothetical protein